MITEKKRYRTIFISDVHLGSPHSKAERLLDFFRSVTFDNLVLVGDIFDDPTRISLPPLHSELVSLVWVRMLIGSKVIYVPGNHDAIFRKMSGTFRNLTIVRNYLHVGAAGERFMVFHGDEIDFLPSGSLMHLIDRWLPIPFWEVIRKLFKVVMKGHLKSFEARAKRAYASQPHDAVICGHVHSPMLKPGYINLGDWITHCTALVEHYDGSIQLINA